MSDELTHTDGEGRARMVDVGDKPVTARLARARARVTLSAEAFEALAANRLAKGDALAVARLAGLQAAKRTADWIPLCHTLPLDRCEVAIELVAERREVRIETTCAARARTGVEMEALVAASAAALAVYDMAKALDRAIAIEEIVLVEKCGGRRGDWSRPEA